MFRLQCLRVGVPIRRGPIAARMPGGVLPRTAGALPSRLTLFLALAVAVSACAACSTGSEEGPTTELEEINADEIVYGVSRRLTREGVQEALLYADSMFMWRDSAYARGMGLTLIIFDEQGRRRANIEADGGRLSNAGNELRAYGNALLRIPASGQEIRTEELNFTPDEDRIWSDRHVVMRESGCVVEGDRFQADMSFDDLKIWGTREGGCSEP